jgi:hypothetical protein
LCLPRADNGECFRAYVEQQVVPTLKPGDIVIMDNLGSHKSVAIRRAIKAPGARLWFLPPYSRTSIRSSRPSPRSSIGYGLLKSEQPTTPGGTSAGSSKQSN